jgi:hypothetical protein
MVQHVQIPLPQEGEDDTNMDELGTIETVVLDTEQQNNETMIIQNSISGLYLLYNGGLFHWSFLPLIIG